MNDDGLCTTCLLYSLESISGRLMSASRLGKPKEPSRIWRGGHVYIAALHRSAAPLASGHESSTNQIQHSTTSTRMSLISTSNFSHNLYTALAAQKTHIPTCKRSHLYRPPPVPIDYDGAHHVVKCYRDEMACWVTSEGKDLTMYNAECITGLKGRESEKRASIGHIVGEPGKVRSRTDTGFQQRLTLSVLGHSGRLSPST